MSYNDKWIHFSTCCYMETNAIMFATNFSKMLKRTNLDLSFIKHVWDRVDQGRFQNVIQFCKNLLYIYIDQSRIIVKTNMLQDS